MQSQSLKIKGISKVKHKTAVRPDPMDEIIYLVILLVIFYLISMSLCQLTIMNIHLADNCKVFSTLGLQSEFSAKLWIRSGIGHLTLYEHK